MIAQKVYRYSEECHAKPEYYIGLRINIPFLSISLTPWICRLNSGFPHA